MTKAATGLTILAAIANPAPKPGGIIGILTPGSLPFGVGTFPPGLVLGFFLLFLSKSGINPVSTPIPDPPNTSPNLLAIASANNSLSSCFASLVFGSMPEDAGVILF